MSLDARLAAEPPDYDPDPPHACQQEGCTAEAVECQYPDYAEEGDGQVVWYCPDHAVAAGFCSICGAFWGGIESFEFLHPGRCDDCQREIEREQREWENPDPYEWLDEVEL
jgi:hypothetical protein